MTEATNTTPATFNVPLSINAVYNPGEWRLSKQVIGKRGGKSWQKIYSTSATGGYLPDAQLEAGLYKVTYWSNGWASSYQFTVTDKGEVINHSEF